MQHDCCCSPDLYVELVGGPLDGLLLDVTGWDPKDIVDGAVLMSDHGVFGPAGLSGYEPADGGDGCGLGRFVWRGDVPQAHPSTRRHPGAALPKSVPVILGRTWGWGSPSGG